MTIPGGQFPTVTSRGERGWWVIPEGALGQLTNLGSGLLQGSVYTVKESTSKPPGEVAGPFTTQAQAQAQANTLNSQGQVNPGNVTKGVTQSVTNGIFTQSTFWIRAGEVIAGGILFYVGAKALFPTAVNTAIQPVKNVAKGTANAAKMGLI